MSAYVVERSHIAYLVHAALLVTGDPNGKLRWQKGADQIKEGPSDRFNSLAPRDVEGAVRMGQILWDENIKSVLERYPDCTRETMPGPIDKDFVFTREDLNKYRNVNPIQVLKACRCLLYQSCQHEDWPQSEAHHFLEALFNAYVNKLPGYEEAEWGAPVDWRT